VTVLQTYELGIVPVAAAVMVWVACIVLAPIASVNIATIILERSIKNECFMRFFLQCFEIVSRRRPSAAYYSGRYQIYRQYVAIALGFDGTFSSFRAWRGK
jgi:hypothetical protein